MKISFNELLSIYHSNNSRLMATYDNEHWNKMEELFPEAATRIQSKLVETKRKILNLEIYIPDNP